MSAALELDDAEILAIEQAELEHDKRDADSAGLLCNPTHMCNTLCYTSLSCVMHHTCLTHV